MAAQKTKVEQADLATVELAGRWRDTLAVRALGTLSELTDQPQLYAICWATLAVGLYRKDRRLQAASVRMLAAEWLATRAKSAIKHRIDRTRPHVPVDGGRYRMTAGDSRAKPLNSFPSGHTAGAVAVATAFASEYPQHRVAAYGIATAVALIQIPRCAHYPSDVGVGAAIGLAAGRLAARATPRDENDAGQSAGGPSRSAT